MIIKELTDNQRRIFIDTAQLYEAFSHAFHESRSFRGGMHWKKAKDREYLFRTRDRHGNGKSLGLRTPETENILARFQEQKRNIKKRLNTLQKRLNEQARFCKAAMINRVPRTVTAVLRIMEQQKILGKNVMVVGTNALYAYEASAGVFLDSPILATGDMDILWDNRAKLKLLGDDSVKSRGLMGLLQKADRSFTLMGRQEFKAVNKNGFMIDLIKPEPRNITQKDIRRMGENGDLEAAEIRNLQWLTASPRFQHIVIGDDGYPAMMAVPDPRSFALHKLWLSKQTDREPIKKQRDQTQGLTAARMVLRYFPDYPFTSSELRMFPKDVFEDAALQISESDLPSGFDIPPDF
ncbi:nucleotidyltransferase domain-containing protein [Desulfobacterales bacterium HSG17]|nr:nucleotidyltransferase domain-containing protein [Desulfobacterales bacterium HSG17]